MTTEKTQLYEAFFQTSSSYFLEQLKHYESGKKLRYNYSSLVFGVFWFLYRKMYLEFLIIFIIYNAETLFENNVLANIIGAEQTRFVNFFVSIFFLFILGLVGNNLYLKKAIRTVQKAESNFSDQEQRLSYLNKKGGTSFIYVSILLALVIIVFALGEK